MMFKKLGIHDLGYEIGQDTSLPWEKVQDRDRKAILQAITDNDQKRPVYIALTVGKENYSFAEDKLYLVGLAYEYSNTNIDNIGVMRHNFEQVYALEYLDKSQCFYPDISEQLVDRVNCNYVVPMVKLLEHYKITGDKQRSEWLASKVLYVSKNSPDEGEIHKCVEKNR